MRLFTPGLDLFFLDLPLGPEVEQLVRDEMFIVLLKLSDIVNVRLAWDLFLDTAWVAEAPRRLPVTCHGVFTLLDLVDASEVEA